MEQSFCGDGAGELLISEALSCYEVLGLTGVEITPISETPSPVILNSDTVVHPTLFVISLQSSTQKTQGYKTPLFPLIWAD